MLRFFDFVYLEVTDWYEKESGARWTGSSLVAMFQSFNILSLLFLIEYYAGFYIASKLFVVCLIIALMVSNDRRYIFQKKNSYDEIRKRWDALSRKEMKLITSWIFFYMVTSTIAFFSIAGFIGANK